MRANLHTQQSDEIHIRELFAALAKSKKLILTGSLTITVLVAIVLFVLPTKYLAGSTVSLGWIGIEQGKVIYVDYVENVTGIVRSGVYDSRIKEDLGLPPQSQFTINAEGAIGAKLVHFNIWFPDQEKAKQILDRLTHYLSEQYSGRVQSRRNSIENAMKSLEDEIQSLQGFVESQKKMISQYEVEVVQLKSKLKAQLSQMESVLKQARGLSDKQSSLKSLQTANVYQFANIHYDNLEKRLLMAESKLERANRELKQTISKIKNKNNEINSLKIDSSQLEGFKVIQKPNIISGEIRPKRLLFVFVTFITSLLLFAFYVLFIQQPMSNE
jgi:LPS O-antigen subunit length determinant protein (WzzB/FepE family)